MKNKKEERGKEKTDEERTKDSRREKKKGRGRKQERLGRENRGESRRGKGKEKRERKGKRKSGSLWKKEKGERRRMEIRKGKQRWEGESQDIWDHCEIHCEYFVRRSHTILLALALPSPLPPPTSLTSLPFSACSCPSNPKAGACRWWDVWIFFSLRLLFPSPHRSHS